MRYPYITQLSDADLWACLVWAERHPANVDVLHDVHAELLRRTPGHQKVGESS